MAVLVLRPKRKRYRCNRYRRNSNPLRAELSQFGFVTGAHDLITSGRALGSTPGADECKVGVSGQWHEVGAK